METLRQYYPISSQPFPEIREKGLTYIDKTDVIYEMVSDIGSNYFFLSRPRRFGKTLLVTTLKAYFEGRKELFEGLAIGKLEKEWKKYPVLHFDMSLAKSQKVSELESELNKKLCGYERIYGKKAEDVQPNQRLRGLNRPTTATISADRPPTSTTPTAFSEPFRQVESKTTGSGLPLRTIWLKCCASSR